MNLRIAEGRVWIDGVERRDIMALRVYFHAQERTRFEIEAFADEIDILEATPKPEPPTYVPPVVAPSGGFIPSGPLTTTPYSGPHYTITTSGDTASRAYGPGDFVS